MTQKPTPRDPHADNELIDNTASEPGAQSGRSGGRTAEEIASRDEEKSALGADPEPTRDTKGDHPQASMPKRSDHQAAQTVGSDFD